MVAGLIQPNNQGFARCRAGTFNRAPYNTESRVANSSVLLWTLKPTGLVMGSRESCSRV
jgi:hypothetical protein